MDDNRVGEVELLRMEAAAKVASTHSLVIQRELVGQMVGEIRELRAERDRLQGAARRLVAAAKAWTIAHREDRDESTRQWTVIELAEAIDSFDPTLSETTEPATPDAERGERE